MARNHESEIIHEELDTDVDSPAVAVVEKVAEIEGEDVDELSTAYECVDGTLEGLFSTPPAPEAQIEVTFTYEGYRITVEQNGGAKFVQVE